jgi:ElaB/YqjD/DUF883 family membrane-anchored ribosome-binding protein|tara:strand:- start:272 stop:493 length:222 start_codon:yes stop_codon:yes gene_type:complete
MKASEKELQLLKERLEKLEKENSNLKKVQVTGKAGDKAKAVIDKVEKNIKENPVQTSIVSNLLTAAVCLFIID